MQDTQPRKILILSANPRSISQLRLEEEKREIREGLRRSRQRDQYLIDTAEAVRYRDIRRAILDHEPHIIHFCGHGEGEEGLVFEDETGQVKLVDAQALAELFELFAAQVECVVLNACYSKVQAEEIAQYINYVVGMSKEIGDRAAIEFAVGFYDAIGAGRSFNDAYKFGCNAIRIAGIAEHLTPALINKTTTNQTVLSSPTKVEVVQELKTSDREILIKKLNSIDITPQLAPQLENRKLLLERVKQEVTKRWNQFLQRSILGENIVINLIKEQQPDKVESFHDIKTGTKPYKELSNDTRILEVFDSEDIRGRLLILGAPGSGKTTSLLELSKALIERAENQLDAPIPIIFNLSSWKDNRQSIAHWLEAELKSKYNISIEFAQELIKKHQILPMLDGLDELATSVEQELCVQQINKFIQEEDYKFHPIVVCSRSQEYSSYSTKLKLDGAISINKLTAQQIQEYLTNTGHNNLWKAISNKPKIMELVTTPFWLKITIISYQEITFDKWQSKKNTTQQLNYLFSAYVRRMFKRDITTRAYTNRKPPTTQKTIIWLIWLATVLENDSQSEFLIEKMQPSLLEDKRQYRIYLICVKLMFGLVVGQGIGLILCVIFKFLFGQFIWVGNGLSIGLILAAKIGDKIHPIESREWSFVNALTGLKSGILYGLTIGFVLSIIAEIIIKYNSLIFYINKNTIKIEVFIPILMKLLPSVIYWSFSLAMILGITFGILEGYIKPKPNIKSTSKFPNQVIWNAAANSVVSFLIIGLALGIGFWVIDVLTNGIVKQLFNYPFSGLVLGLVGALPYRLIDVKRGTSSIASIQHFTLRFILYLNGCIPWDFARFLEYCTERSFIQRIGSRHSFFHPIVQERFAKKDPKSISPTRKLDQK
ncbi:CHAT domain-containing protein [Nostoc sp. UHCC 0251]|uniref:CHAT domain-containing protein n=1 Tax=Nostoc sp. UHCC 0251 TaxID=3110240 RepID=UPI002B21D00B|nr:CHAT domain-containing protein [Nostoc sp. UHCC 0251]MEA5622444.1 CHAT domain-containing protein [Nostoc sp. UHCC 0251]